MFCVMFLRPFDRVGLAWPPAIVGPMGLEYTRDKVLELYTTDVTLSRPTRKAMNSDFHRTGEETCSADYQPTAL